MLEIARAWALSQAHQDPRKQLVELIVLAYRERARETLGFSNWDAYGHRR
jgi:hypothetical protein